MGFEVGFLFILLNIIAIRFAVSSPVDMADFVAVIILAMLGELDAEALVGAFVNAGQEALDGVARDESEPAVFGERRWDRIVGWMAWWDRPIV